MKNIVYTALFLISCSTQPSIEPTNSTHDSVSGNWKVTSNEMVRMLKKDDIPEDGYGSLCSFFGFPLWSQSTGKTFSLLDNGRFSTNLVDSVKLAEIDMKYTVVNKDLFEVSCKFHKDSMRNIMPVKYELNGDKMTWLIDELLEIELVKQE